MAERENDVELSGEAVGGYVRWFVDKVNHYGWEVGKFGVASGPALGGLNAGYDYLRMLPLLSNVDSLVHQVQFAPEAIALSAGLFTIWNTKTQVVDRIINRLK